ncbi:MAG: glycosyltransferase [Bacilli bacterium]
MKICACIVLYNPEMEVISNVKNLLGFTSDVLVLDNSDYLNRTSQQISHTEGVTYVWFKKNTGIANALKYAADYSSSKGFDYLLTMDQDSVFPIDKKREILSLLKANFDYSILALNYNGKNQSSSEVSQVNDWITSGSFIKLEDYKKVDGFNPLLFIDYVDYDLCEQFVSKGLKIGVMNRISLDHQLGHPDSKRIFGKELIFSNHSPERDYYRYRNELYLYRRNKKYFKALHRAEKKNLILILLLEKNKIGKLKMIIKGKRDARKGRLGKIDVLK